MTMTSPTVVTRDIELDIDESDAWALIGDAEGWGSWLVDDADVDVETGAAGSVVDDGAERHVQIVNVDHGRSVEFVWWPAGTDGQASSVAITVERTASGTALLRVVESFPPRTLAATALGAATRWEARALFAWSACHAPALV